MSGPVLAEWEATALSFGVAIEQVRRDHLISHVLAAISPAAQLRVLTADAFVAAKLTAWMNRSAPRDLYDLWAMNEAGLIGPAAAATFARYGPTGRALGPAVFDNGVDDEAWNRALAHQTRLEVTAREALSTVREAWARAERACQETD